MLMRCLVKSVIPGNKVSCPEICKIRAFEQMPVNQRVNKSGVLRSLFRMSFSAFFTIENDVFGIAKGYLSRCKRLPFTL